MTSRKFGGHKYEDQVAHRASSPQLGCAYSAAGSLMLQYGWGWKCSLFSVPGKPAILSLLCHHAWQPASPSTLALSLHGSCPIVPLLSGCASSGSLDVLWGWEGWCMEKLQTLPSTGPHHTFMQRLNDVFCFAFFFSPFLVIPNIVLAFLTPAQPWPVIFSKLATMLRSFSRAVMGDLEPLIMHV